MTSNILNNPIYKQFLEEENELYLSKFLRDEKIDYVYLGKTWYMERKYDRFRQENANFWHTPYEEHKNEYIFTMLLRYVMADYKVVVLDFGGKYEDKINKLDGSIRVADDLNEDSYNHAEYDENLDLFVLRKPENIDKFNKLVKSYAEHLAKNVKKRVLVLPYPEDWLNFISKMDDTNTQINYRDFIEKSLYPLCKRARTWNLGYDFISQYPGLMAADRYMQYIGSGASYGLISNSIVLNENALLILGIMNTLMVALYEEDMSLVVANRQLSNDPMKIISDKVAKLGEDEYYLAIEPQEAKRLLFKYTEKQKELLQFK